MAIDINKRLSQLRARRDGTDRMAMDASVRDEILTKALYPGLEPWEKRGSANQPHTRYAIGAMQPVSDTYTRVSHETANRVANQLNDRLAKAGISVEFRLQGSVPLDVHIRRVSDVDLLAIDTSILAYMTYGIKAQSGGYVPTARTSAGVLSQLRDQIEVDLEAAFPAADLDTTGSKAVKISGGSLLRSVDVVPAHWLDSVEYQSSGREIDRGVKIYNKGTGRTIENFPFLHIARIKARCDLVGGGLRKAIRLCKNVKADADRDITLPSFDIAATTYHTNTTALQLGQYFDLAVLAETQRFLDILACNFEFAKTLTVPDGSRTIFDSEEELIGLLNLSIEMDELFRNVYEENAPEWPANIKSHSEMRDTIQVLDI
ncbi:MAG TPA: hypothetical protein VGL01_04470 [Trinickia sp.]|uniref:hypothetical protein n=1 Tax=Trinickia sp. TaxID=2571163 RepID=UPI002F4291F0